jgi:hypothetical protein
MKLSLMGVTLVAASGDDGVAGAPARTDPFRCGYYPMFPASSPYVTAVGATMVSYNAAINGENGKKKLKTNATVCLYRDQRMVTPKLHVKVIVEVQSHRAVGFQRFSRCRLGKVLQFWATLASSVP